MHNNARLSHVSQLFPVQQLLPLENLYLGHQIRAQAAALAEPYFYANFVTSLDGRIAIPDEEGDGVTVPPNIANDRDWRLFQELVAQADIVISTGRYLREWADGKGQEILRSDDSRFADLSEWRESNGLPPQPDLAIVSTSLDFPIPELLQSSQRRIVMFTTAQAAADQVAEVESKLGPVYVVGEASVDGRQMAAKLGELNYSTVYSAAGPKIAHMLLSAGVLNRLYLTHVCRILGGSPFSSIVEGALFRNASDFQLNTIYWDSNAMPDEELSVGQLFFSYDKLRTG